MDPGSASLAFRMNQEGGLGGLGSVRRRGNAPLVAEGRQGVPPLHLLVFYLSWCPTCLPQVQVSSLGLLWPPNEDQRGVCCPAGWQPGRLFHNLGRALWTEARECHRGHCTGYSFPRCPKSPDSVHRITHARPHSKWADGGPWSHLHHVVWKPYPGTLLLSLSFF